MHSNFKLAILIFGHSLANHAFVLNKHEKRPNNVYRVKNVVQKIKKKDIQKTLRKFVRCCRPNRLVGTVGHKEVAPWLVKEIKKRDLENKNIVTVDEFSPDIDYAKNLYLNDFKTSIESIYKPDHALYKKWKSFTDSMILEIDKRKKLVGRNVIWEKKGILSPDEILVIGAHYDTIANDKETLKILTNSEMPGADDNGSGVSVALNLISLLSKLDLPKTVQIVFFDWEELGFLGSRAYVKKYHQELKKKKFQGYINLEMLGHDSKTQDKTKRNKNMKVYIRRSGEKGHQSDSKLAKRMVKAGKSVAPAVKFEIVSNSFNSSDHINFWEHQLPAMTYTQDWENDFNTRGYHGPNDFVETINMNTLSDSFRHIAGAVISWAFDIL
jgi:acetylornithine deacetylase/succinyl-diaminopimelate desuccinylase-like protein